ncbi:MAG: Ig-like domain-containing protein [Chloroflexota bacterium]|nr:Ig-like domain-containing protein [Chloroflexota bacterium]
MHTRLLRVLLLLLAFFLASCNLSGERREQVLPTATGATSARPVVTIVSPANNSETVVNQPLAISANAVDTVGITQIQLLANGRVVHSIRSEQPTGSPTMTLSYSYTPLEAGTLNIGVIAYRSSVTSDPSTVTVNVRAAQAQVTVTSIPAPNVPIINPNDPTCRALANTGINLRQGPGTNYPRISGIAAGTQIPITGRIADNSWWQVRVGVNVGWVIDDFVTIYGICTAIPVVQPPPPPTNTPLPATNTPFVFPPTFTPIIVATATPAAVDLEVVRISGSPALSLAVGGSVSSTYEVLVRNNSGGAVPRFESAIVILPTNQTVQLPAVENLRAGDIISLTAGITFSTPGSYILRAVADSGNVVTESNEANNDDIFQVNVTSP